jgi:hypothetical protein
MNQDQVKSRLLALEPDTEEFSVIFSGKQSKKVNGLYYPERREIIIHNKNFTNDSGLMYTAIHEYAHHIHFTRSPVPISSRSHTTEYRNILHELLERAEQAGTYTNIFSEHPDFVRLTHKIRDEFLVTNGQLMKDLGALLVKAEALCQEHHARFEDYVERALLIDRRSASTLMRIHGLDISPAIGYENMRTVANIRNKDQRQMAMESFSNGKSPDMVKAEVQQARKTEREPIEMLFAEKQRIERTIDSLREKLKTVDDRIDRLREL